VPAPSDGATDEDPTERIVKAVLGRIRAIGPDGARLRQRVLALEQRLDDVVLRFAR
jgi:hypothetical protein